MVPPLRLSLCNPGPPLRLPGLLPLGLLTLLFLCTVWTHPLLAQTWDGGGSNTRWSTANNWDPNGAPANNGSADLIFAGSTRTSPNVNTAWNVHSITFSNNAAAFTLGGNTLTLQAGITHDDDSTQTINNNIVLGAAQTWSSTSTGALRINGTINNGGFLLSVDNTASTTLSGRISGTGGLTKNGTGTLQLGPGTSNTYTGDTTVNEGTLLLAKGGAVVAVPGALVIGDGSGTDIVQLGTVDQIGNSSSVTINSSGVLDLTSLNETIGSLMMTGGSITGTGTLTLGGDVTSNPHSSAATLAGNLGLGSGTRTFSIDDGAADKDMNITARVTGIAGFVKSGAGTLNLANSANSFSGGFTLNAGTVEITNAASIGIATAGTASYIGAQGITINGGTLDFSPTGAGFDFTGFNRDVTIDGGTVRLNPTSQVTGLQAAGTMTFGTSGGTLNIAQQLAAGVNMGNLTVNSAVATPAIIAYSTIANSGGGTAGGWDSSGRDLNINNLAGTGALRFDLTGGAAAGLQPASFGGSLVFNGQPSGSASVGSLGTTVGRLNLTTAATTTVTGGITFSNAMQVSAVGAARTLDANLAIAAGETAFQGVSTSGVTLNDLTLGATVGGRTLTISNAATATLDLRFRDDSVNNNVGGIQLNANVVIQDGGTLQFKKSATVASEGIDQINVNADITGQGSTAADSVVNLLLGAGTGGTNGVTFATGAGTAGTDLIVNGSGRYGLRIVGSYAALTNLVTTERLQDLTGSGGTLTLAATGNTARTWSNAPSTATSLKLGFDSSGGSNPTNTLGAAVNDLANFGGLVVKGGVVVAGRDQNFIGTGNSTFDITGGTLRLYTLSGARTLTFSGDGTFAGGTIDGGPGGAGKGTLVIGGNLNSDGSTLLNRPNLTMNPNSGTNHIQGGSTLIGVGTFTKTGSGTVQLDQSIDVLAIQINQGTLLLGASDRISDSATMSFNGGTFASGGFDETLGTLTMTANSRIDLGGAGTSVLNFSDSHLLSWTGTLIIANYTEGGDQVFFGNGAFGLSAGQVSQIFFEDPYGGGSGIYDAEILSDGRIRPRIVPEPATVVTLGMLVTGLLWRERRRFGTLLRCRSG